MKSCHFYRTAPCSSKYSMTLSSFSMTFPSPWLFSMTFQAWKMVFLNSMTFHDQGAPCNVAIYSNSRQAVLFCAHRYAGARPRVNERRSISTVHSLSWPARSPLPVVWYTGPWCLPVILGGFSSTDVSNQTKTSCTDCVWQSPLRGMKCIVCPSHL